MEEYSNKSRLSPGILGFSFILFCQSPMAFSETAIDSSPQLGLMNQQLAQNTFIYNPRTLRWSAVKDGKVIRTGHGSGGRSYCKDIGRGCKTPTGTYHVISKGSPSCRSSRYPVGKGGAPMPYCMFFSKLYAIHGSPDVPNYNASHGCIRVPKSDARWLHGNFINVGTRVVVKSY